VATTPESVTVRLEELNSLINRYGCTALQGDSQFFSTLEKQRKLWGEEYALDVLSRQLRPQANEAFRRKDYSTAAQLYSRFLMRLSPVEIKKLDFAEKYCQGLKDMRHQE
jgi:hypothetical protein